MATRTAVATGSTTATVMATLVITDMTVRRTVGEGMAGACRRSGTPRT